MPGVYKDEAGGHGACPWRSGIRREGFEHVKSGRHASCAEASLRVLELLQAHPPFIEKDRFTLAAGRHVNAAQLARLVEAARADAAAPAAPAAAPEVHAEVPAPAPAPGAAPAAPAAAPAAAAPAAPAAAPAAAAPAAPAAALAPAAAAPAAPAAAPPRVGRQYQAIVPPHGCQRRPAVASQNIICNVRHKGGGAAAWRE